MKRKIYDKLIEWKNNKDSKPLIITGARQVGKTYIINEFCSKEFEEYISINLFERQDIVDLYKSRLTSDEKFMKLKILLNTDIEKDNLCIFIDEIQESEEIISELKYFNEKHKDIKIICSGSLLGIKLKRTHFSFPVGKVNIITLYPMDFEEFLLAFNENYLIEEIKKSYNDNTPLLDSLHEKALNYYRLYLYTGGMPEAVDNLVNISGDLTKYNKIILKNIIEAYFNDMDKYVISNSESLKIEKLYKSIPTQLANESKKFQYSKIEKNAKSRDYESAMDWLNAGNLIIKSFQIKEPLIPLEGFVKDNYFKIYLSDCGILRENLGILPIDILNDNLSLYKGVIAENFVATQLLSNGYSLYYWLSDGIAEVDFLLYNEDGIIPVEVKANNNIKSKSLKVYMDKYKPKYAIRLSQKNFGFMNNIKSVPLYSIFCIKK